MKFNIRAACSLNDNSGRFQACNQLIQRNPYNGHLCVGLLNIYTNVGKISLSQRLFKAFSSLCNLYHP
jgi:DNA-binding SARP family transcriptional activator